MSDALDRTAELAAQACAELALLAYPNRPWTKPLVIDGVPCADVLIVGGGMSGLAIAHGLRRDGVTNVAVLDARPAGQEGVWDNFARMPELRTPKGQNGMDFGQPSLSPQQWFIARHGRAAWDRIARVSRRDWADYVRWYRATLDLPVENEVDVTAIGPGPRPDVVAVETSRGRRLARNVVLATGFEGGSRLRFPAVVREALPPGRYDHACTAIDFTRFAGARIGILGHGASAFDAAVVALQSGAASVDLCFRRAALPTVNPHRFLDSAGLMANWTFLDDAVRWAIARHMRIADQPPAHGSFHAALGLSGFNMHPASPWQAVALADDAVLVRTPARLFRFDHLICATGYSLDLGARPELRQLADKIVLWRDRYTPPPGEDWPGLGDFPYLAGGYEFQPRDPAHTWIGRIYAFNFTAALSAGPHSTSISGQKHALPRLVRAVVKRLMLDEQGSLVADLRAYDEPDLILHPARSKPMPEMRDLPINELTPEAFAPFGTVVAPMADGTPFGPLDAVLQLGGGTPRFYAMRVPGRGLTVTRINRHRNVTQTLASAGGKPWLIAVAPAPIEDTEDAVPDPAAIRAFRIPGDVAIVLHRGTWHAGPLVTEAEASFFNLELSDTNVTDHWICDLADRFGVGFRLS